MEFSIRQAKEEDRKDVIDLFNYYVLNSFAAYPDERVAYDFFDKLNHQAIDGSFYVISLNSGGIIGFGLLKKFYPFKVFNSTAEIAYFLNKDHTGEGLGKIILDQLIADARKKNIRTLLASISSLNIMSIQFHHKYGFSECGRFNRVGNKFGKDFDMVWMQKFI
jgi:L-amino acid N-acyltransferase YncA